MRGRAWTFQLTNQQTQFSHACTSGSSGSSACPGWPGCPHPSSLRGEHNAQGGDLPRSSRYQKTDAGYEGLGVDVLEQIRIQAKRRKVDYRVAKSVNDGRKQMPLAAHEQASPSLRVVTFLNVDPDPEAKPLVW